MNIKPRYLIFGAALIVVLGGVLYWSEGQVTTNTARTPKIENTEYNPAVSANDFVSKIENKYFTLKPGTKFTYKENTKDGLERIELVVTNKTKKVMGVTTTVVQDTAWLDNKLKEDTTDLYAQDKDGNVWYFGETVNNYDNGTLKDHEGSWEAGKDGAKPGIIMHGNPKVGDSYLQEYYRGVAEDMADNVALGQKITVPYGTFDNCLKTRDWSRIDPNLNEYKFYCPAVGFLVSGDSVKEPSQEKLELVSISTQ